MPPAKSGRAQVLVRVAFRISSPYLEAKMENSGTYRQFVELQRKSYREEYRYALVIRRASNCQAHGLQPMTAEYRDANVALCSKGLTI